MKLPFKALSLVFFLLPGLTAAQTARKGLVDLRNIAFDAPVALSGEWEFYMAALVSPEAFDRNQNPPPEYIDFPATWNGQNESLDPGWGYATYRLKVLVSNASSMAIELPHFYSSYVLWINGEQTASNGRVGITKEETIPQWLPQVRDIPVDDDTLDIVIHVANFHHAKGGVRENVLLATSELLTFKRSIALTSYLVMCGILGLIAVIFFLIYLLSKQDSTILYLGSLSLTWAVRSMFSNLYFANYLVPQIPWEICVKIEYLSLYLTMVWAVLFIGALFRSEVNLLLKYTFCISNGMFAAITLVFDAAIYTRFLPVYLSFAAALLVYIIYVLIRAIFYQRESVWLMISCLFLAAILFAYDLVSYEGFASYNPIVISTGYLAIFTLMSLSLLYKLGLLKSSSGGGNILTYEDLYGPPKQSK